MSYFNFNGKLYKNDTLIIDANNRGLRYGDGVFETLKIKNNNIIFEDDHFARLWKGLKTLQINIPKHFNPDNLKEEILALAKKNNRTNLARVRVTVFRGDGGLYEIENAKLNYIIQTWALENNYGKWNDNGLILEIYQDVKKNCDIISNLKTNNFLPYVMAAIFAKKQKCNDAILLNNFGRICDTTIANIFFIKDEIIYTPDLSEGCVAGVFRENFISKIAETDFKCIEKKITINDILQADEVFLTNALFNIRWVKQINNVPYTNHLTQKIYTDILPIMF